MKSGQLGLIFQRLGEGGPAAAETDAQLLARYARGEHTAFAGLVKRHSGLVWGVARRILHRHQDAEDVLQASFLALARNCKSLKVECSLAPWLYTVAARVALQIKRRRRQEESLVETTEPSLGDLADPCMEAAGRELARAFDEEMQRLPQKFREALVLCCLEGWARDEAAAATGCTPAVMKKRLERGRKLLRNRLERRGIAVPATLLLVGLANRAAPAAVCAAACQEFETASPNIVALAAGAVGGSVVMKTIVLTSLFGLAAAGISIGGNLIRTDSAVPKAVNATAQGRGQPVTTHLHAARLADDAPKRDAIDSDTIAAYEKLGAVYGGFRLNPITWSDEGFRGHLEFEPGKDAAAKHLPGFRLSPLRKGGLPGPLPAVGVQFGLDFAGTSLTDAGLKELKELKNLTALVLLATQVTDAGLIELKELKNLSSLDLSETHVADAGLKELKELKNLSSLHLRSTKVTGAGLKELKELKNLSELALSDTQLTDAGLKDLTGLKNLSSLDLGGTRVTDAGLKDLKELKNLTSLYLPGPQVTDAALKELKELKNLSSLDLGGAEVTDAGMKELKELKNLSRLRLMNTRVTDAGLKELKEFKNLSSLNIFGTKVTDAGLKELKELKNLSSLYLGGTLVTDAGLKELKELKNLSSLDLGSTQVTGAGLKELKELRNFSSLILGGPKVTDAGLKELKELKNLSSLHVSGAQVTDVGLKELTELKSLTSLSLGDMQTTDAGLKELKELKSLTKLELRSPKVTDAGLKELKELKNLTMLELRSPRVTDAGLKELKGPCPKRGYYFAV